MQCFEQIIGTNPAHGKIQLALQDFVIIREMSWRVGRFKTGSQGFKYCNDSIWPEHAPELGKSPLQLCAPVVRMVVNKMANGPACNHDLGDGVWKREVAMIRDFEPPISFSEPFQFGSRHFQHGE